MVRAKKPKRKKERKKEENIYFETLLASTSIPSLHVIIGGTFDAYA